MDGGVVTRVRTLADAESVAIDAAAEIARLLEDARSRRGRAHVALSGGSTPARTYELLAQTLDDWESIEVWFADERCVPPEHDQSNYRLAYETLLQPADVPDGRVHRMLGELGPQEGARRYAQELRAHGIVRGPQSAAGGGALRELARGSDALQQLDVAVLGIGPEGHIASLFPHHPALKATSEQPCVGIGDSPKPPPQRITLTLPVLRATRRCLLIATGAQKAGAISAMLGEPSEAVPASLLARERLTMIVDDAASAAPGAPWPAHRP